MILYIVSTPIGNLKDITVRALDVLKSVDYVFCEDTRVTSRLLSKYGISTKLRRHDNFKEQVSAKGIVKLLDDGHDVAIVSDGGTPVMSDPGYRAINLVIKKGEHKVVVVPGASAILTALVASGLPPTPFTFLGFLPKGKESQKVLQKYLLTGDTIIFFESPKRVKTTLEYISSKFPTTEICIAREMTKLFEQTKTGKINEVLTLLGKEIPEKGEFTFVVKCNT